MLKIFKKQEQVQDVDSKGVVTKYVNAFGNLDSDRDVSEKGSFTKTINENFKRLRWFLNHNKSILLGVPLEAKQDEYGLLVRSQLNLNKEIGRDMYEDYKLYAENGRSLEHSIGCEAVKYKMDKENDIRYVQEWKLWEYSSLTHWGANDGALLQDIKSKKDLNEAIALMEKMCKGNYTQERLQDIEKQLNILKSLIGDEPLITQQEYEPTDWIKYFNNNLKMLKNG